MSQASTQGMLEVAHTSSTMDLARELVLEGRTDVWAVRAGYQTEGRGRRGARWVAAPGESLLVTYILPLPPALRQDVGRLAIVAGAATAQAIRQATATNVRVKWPNDLLLDDRKLGGILVEIPGPPAALVGVGVNVNTAAFPAELAQRAISLRQHTCREWNVRDLAMQVHAALLRLCAAPWEECLSVWRGLDVSAGRFYAVITESGEEVATALEVDDYGALRVRCASGDCITVASAHGLA